MIKKDKKNSQGEGGGRPSKMKTFVEAFEEILKKNESDVIYLTDDDLRICCNELLEEDAQICQSTFEKWKAGKLKDNPEYQMFLRLYKKALINQKRLLFIKLQADEKTWQKIAWIIERKFSEWNLRQIGEFNNKNTNLNMDADVDELEGKSKSQLEEMRQKLLG